MRYAEIQAKDILEEERKSGNEQAIKEKLRLYDRARDKAAEYARRSMIIGNDMNKCIKQLEKN
ncbi:MAG: hypothetical protein C4617_04660 [Candidatus Liberibacter europaeus]|uniref:Uncharacterized protein n=1 Tax=Candidatus Liberibacter europaeus TaxID=744859 RepID=A0A2T4VWZ0_9HYPH|nr:hypothetical protein [Candidatus Liberibacter europaeus]PTL86295.1 MAG: hypothetical protein C4617_04660 [Candidatus Liberibacter europaeus]